MMCKTEFACRTVLVALGAFAAACLGRSELYFHTRPGSATEAPSSLTYTHLRPTYVRAADIFDNQPTVTGGAPEEFTVSPALPAGILLDPRSGVISGAAPDTASVATEYVVTAANWLGRATATLTIEVLDGFVVNSTADGGDGAPGDGFCNTNAGMQNNTVCTLRAAVEECNILPGAQAVLVPDGLYLVASVLTVTAGLVINGQSIDGTIIDGGGATGVLTVAVARLALGNVTVQRGAASGGAGLNVESGTFALTQCRFLDNASVDNEGGAILIRPTSAPATIERCLFSGNSSTNAPGGAIYVRDGAQLTIKRSEFVGNRAVSANAGAIRVQSVNENDVTIDECRFRGNSADRGASAFDGSATITRSSFFGNNGLETTVEAGGSINMTNVTIAHNRVSTTSATGGGIFINNGEAFIANSTIAFNRIAGGTGAGIGGHSGSIFHVRSSIVAFNLSELTSTLQDCNFGPNDLQPPMLGNSVVTSSDCETVATDIVVTDPGLIEVGTDNGGFVETVALRPDSPAIDLGDLGACPGTDARLEPRPADHDGDGRGGCDAGAFELQADE